MASVSPATSTNSSNSNSTSQEQQLFEAANDGDRSTLQAVLEGAATVNLHSMHGMYGETALYAAAAGGHVGCMSDLIKGGANVDWGDYDGCTPLYTATARGHKGCASLLLEADANVDLADGGAYKLNGWAPLHWAAKNGDEACASLLVQAGAKLGAAACHGSTPLSLAHEGGHAAVVAVLQGESRWRRRRALALIREQREAGSDWKKARKVWGHSNIAKH